MSFNAEKIANLIHNECGSIEERCEGYRNKVLDAIIEILKAEKEHKVQRIRIQQEINEICNSVGDFLVKKSDTDNSTAEVSK